MTGCIYINKKVNHSRYILFNEMSDRKYLVDPKTKRKYPIGGCLISGKPSDGPKFGAIRVLGAKDLPPGVDLRALMTPIEQQLDTYAW